MRNKTALGLSVALLIALCCAAAYSQSGRRQTKPPPAAPVPTPTPEPTPIPSAPKKDDDLTVILVASGDRASTFSNYPLSFDDAARNGCADRLSKRTSASVDVADREITRGEAITRAKADKFTYVVLITLIEDRMSASSSNNPQLEVDYVVFAPSTAKVLASGRTYENSARKGPLSIPRSRGTNVPMIREEMLRRAGEDAADRILKVVNISTLPGK
ncbi:MAG TPA: hypothetical protein VFS76_02430 [Pyrinomonadaceae bacterium]|nr:hypothetical protein [Pyrinomonadaceae bacterium]